MTTEIINKLIHRSGFSNTYEITRLERLVWLTALDLQQFVNNEQWQQIKEYLAIPDNFNRRKNANYLTKKTLDQPEGYLE